MCVCVCVRSRAVPVLGSKGVLLRVRADALTQGLAQKFLLLQGPCRSCYPSNLVVGASAHNLRSERTLSEDFLHSQRDLLAEDRGEKKDTENLFSQFHTDWGLLPRSF